MSLSIQVVFISTSCILAPVPKLWSETIEEHRRAIHDATLDTTAALAREHGLAG